MIDFLKMIGNEIGELIAFFVTIALLQNVVLTSGFGASMSLHVMRKPKTIWLFSALLTAFSVTTVAIAYPLDYLIGTAITNYWRPLMIVGIAAVLYIIATLVMRSRFSDFYAKVSAMMPMAAFNTLVIGIAMVSNVQFNAGFSGAIGLTVGACLAFSILTWLTAEGIERLDNPDMPDTFRGSPATLVYIGLVALAMMGFTSDFSLI